ncbi:MAG: carbohydrate ABC transporter permease [Actinobacteria bacterium]|nr:carbohydrate ABC transporter permease [Actinomycetota bacterium]
MNMKNNPVLLDAMNKYNKNIINDNNKMKLWNSKKNRKIVGDIVAIIILLVGAFIMIFPFLWMFSTALKNLSSVVAYPPQWIPRPMLWSNFIKAWNFRPFTTYLLNTLITTIIPLGGIVFVSSLVAYGFSRIKWKGRDFVFMLCLATMMLPPQVTLFPLFVIFNKIGWIDTFYPLIVPYYFGAGTGTAFYIFLLKQFYTTIPKELEDAAKIDGCGPLRTWFSIMLPLTKPGLVAVIIFGFMRGWTEFMSPLIYLSSESHKTLVLGLAQFQAEVGIAGMTGTANLNMLMAASVLVTIPPLLILMIGQKYFIKGIVMSGLKM